MTPNPSTKEPILYIMCGLPYSGKSTIAKKIVEYTKAKLVSYDRIWARNRKQGQTPDPNSIEEWKETIKASFDEIKSELQKGNSVIFDHVNPKRTDRKLAIDLAKSVKGARALIIFVNTPAAVIEKRRIDNQNNLTRFNIAPDNMKKVYELWEPLDKEERAYEFLPGQDIGQFVKQMGIAV